jgi:hypothetical protein
VWGGIHGLLFIVYSFLPTPSSQAAWWRRFAGAFIFFNLTCIGRLFFRAEDLSSAFVFLTDLCSAGSSGVTLGSSCYVLLAASLLLHNYAEPRIERWAELFDNRRPFLLALLAMAVLILCSLSRLHFQAYQAFIYFQF